jgi:hypothetical protein
MLGCFWIWEPVIFGSWIAGRIYNGRTLTIYVGFKTGQWDTAQRLSLLDGLLLGLLEGLWLGMLEVVVET